MANKVSIIMYHYVRDLKNSAFPRIKGLDISLFENQIKYILGNYNVITLEQVVDSIYDRADLPEKAALLTFDDGYTDHYEYVLPVLRREKIQGSFFIALKPLYENKLLDVNKIHFILAAVPDVKVLVKDIEERLPDFSYYFEKINKETDFRFDSKEVVFVKKLLQKELPKEIRQAMIDDFFKKYVSRDEASFSKSLYMDMGQINRMRECGMYIGAHGYTHEWLDSMSETEQEKEINLSAKFLNTVKTAPGYFAMSYPSGKYNDDTLVFLKQNNFKIGLIVKPAVADLGKDNAYLLPRLDTNDLPKD